MKVYNVYFVIKRNKHGELKKFAMNADNKRDAFEKVEVLSNEIYNAHAFKKTTEVPKWVTYKSNTEAIEWNGFTYTKAYRDRWHTYLW